MPTVIELRCDRVTLEFRFPVLWRSVHTLHPLLGAHIFFKVVLKPRVDAHKSHFSSVLQYLL